MFDHPISNCFRYERVFRRLLVTFTHCIMFSEMICEAKVEDEDEPEDTRFNEKEATFFNSVASSLSRLYFLSPESITFFQGLLRMSDTRQLLHLSERMEIALERARVDLEDFQGNPLVWDEKSGTAYHRAILECLLMCAGFLSTHLIYFPGIQGDELFEEVIDLLKEVFEKYDVPNMLQLACETSDPFGENGAIAIKTVLTVDIYKTTFTNTYLKNE